MRDGIPEIIRRSGATPVTYIAGVEEYGLRLRDKLREETEEFVQADGEDAREELADVLEVVYALARELGMNLTELEQLRARKAAERGGFKQRVVWTSTEHGTGHQ
ncbi:MazG-like family protein [Streptomyces caelestis]|uniref:MazG-like family protein n=1 Tax=Streptomyces caelestis TaxID=36816 RepID=UPI0037013553